MIKAFLSRKYNPTQTTGHLIIFEDDNKIFECKTLEPQNNNNEKSNSCIPTNDYTVKRHISPKFGECFEVQNVVNRSNILIHIGNYRKNTTGCILVGSALYDLNSDGILDISNSSDTFKKLLKLLPDEFILTIR
jgi:hypothetical protein